MSFLVEGDFNMNYKTNRNNNNTSMKVVEKSIIKAGTMTVVAPVAIGITLNIYTTFSVAVFSVAIWFALFSVFYHTSKSKQLTAAIFFFFLKIELILVGFYIGLVVSFYLIAKFA